MTADRQAAQVAINAVIGSGRRTLTIAGSAGNAVHVARYRYWNWERDRAR